MTPPRCRARALVTWLECIAERGRVGGWVELGSPPALILCHIPSPITPLRYTPLLIAIEKDQGDVVRHLITECGVRHDATASVSQTGYEGALGYAVNARSVKCVDALLECGADPNTTRADGATALHLLFTDLGASDRHSGARKAMAESLLRHGADPSATLNR